MHQWCLHLSGLYGVIFAEWYSDVLSMLASHGLIVVGVDLFWPAVSSNPTTGNNTTISPIQIPALTRNQSSCIKWFNGSARWSTALVKTNILVFIHELTWYSCWRAVHVCRIAGKIYYTPHSFCRIKIYVFSPNLLPSIFSSIWYNITYISAAVVCTCLYSWS